MTRRATKRLSKGCNENFSPDDFWSYLPQHSYIYVPTRELWPKASIDAILPRIDEMKPSRWLDQNRAVSQMTWAPGHGTIIADFVVAEGGWINRPGERVFNLYLPPTIEHGDAAFAKHWIDHVHKIYPDEADEIIRWCAHRVQKPWEKINHAIVLGGAPGIGKDTILEPLRHAVGPWNFAEVSPRRMMGRFNGYLKSVVLRVSETRDLGEFSRYEFYEELKTVCAAPPDAVPVDEKNIREYLIPNTTGVVMTTNYKTDGMYLPIEDRRTLVAWSKSTIEDFDKEYWQRFWTWYDIGGIRNTAAYLAALDISDFDPKAPPRKTPAFYDIVAANVASEDLELNDVFDEMGWPDAITLSNVVTRANGSLVGFLTEKKNRRVILVRFEKCGYQPVRNPDAKDGIWKVQGKRAVVYAKTILSTREQLASIKKLLNTGDSGVGSYRS